jgi:hypothetical protein
MSMTRKIIALAGVLLIAGAASTAEAAKKRVATRGQQETSDAAALVRMMDADKNGVVSKEEFLNYMGHVYDHLDVNQNMEVRSSELRRLPATISDQFSTICERSNPPPRCISGDSGQSVPLRPR